MTTIPKPSITAIVLTRDEGLHLRRCIESLQPVVARVCVVDSGSTDDTLGIARSMGADVFSNDWINHAAQFNWALDHCDIRTDWVLRLDADEYLESALQAEMRDRLPDLDRETHGVLLKRKYFFMRRWVRHGGMYPIYSLRLWRNGSARIENRWMDEHALLTRGRTTRFHAAFVDDNLRDLAWWSRKHVHYATLEAVQVILERMGIATDGRQAESALPGRASTKRWMKERVYNRLPLGLGPFLYLQYRLFLRLGILDGASGVAFHVLQGFWYRLLADLRRHELDRSLSGIHGTAARVMALEKLTGLKIRAFPDR